LQRSEIKKGLLLQRSETSFPMILLSVVTVLT
jgi:hypothetical protein